MKALYTAGAVLAALIVAAGTYFGLRSKQHKQEDRTKICTLSSELWQGCKDYARKLNIFASKPAEDFQSA